MFDPRKYCVYNKETDECEQQFKQLEDLPAYCVHEFKRAANGGYVRQSAVENIALAYWIAQMENTYWEDVIKFRKSSTKRLVKLENLAQAQGEIALKNFYDR